MLLPLTVGAVNLPSFDVNVLVPVQELPEPPLVLEVPGLVSEKKLNPCDDELLDEDDELPDDDEDDEDEPFLLLGASAIAPISTAAMTMPPPLAISLLPVGDSSGAPGPYPAHHHRYRRCGRKARRPSTQKAIPAATPTLSESTPPRMGIPARTSAAARVASDSPGPSAPNSRAIRSPSSASFVSRSPSPVPVSISSIGTASGSGVSATSRKPAARSAARPSGRRGIHAHGKA